MNGSFCNLCALAVGLALHIFYTVLTSPKKGETAVHCCNPTFSVLVMLVSRNVFHVVSALQSVVCLSSLPPVVGGRGERAWERGCLLFLTVHWSGKTEDFTEVCRKKFVFTLVLRYYSNL